MQTLQWSNIRGELKQKAQRNTISHQLTLGPIGRMPRKTDLLGKDNQYEEVCLLLEERVFQSFCAIFEKAWSLLHFWDKTKAPDQTVLLPEKEHEAKVREMLGASLIKSFIGQ